MIDGLKRLSGAKEVSQDDFAAGVGTYLVKYDALPIVKTAEVKSAVGKFTVDKITLKITSKAVEKGGKWTAGPYLLTGDVAKLTELKGKLLILIGTLVEGEKAAPTLELTSVEEVVKKTK